MPTRSERDQFIKSLLKQFESKNYLRHFLPDNTSIILQKDERKLNRLRRFDQSPFPLLSSIEYFSNSVGKWNEQLMNYGIKSRTKLGDLPSNEVGVNIHLIRHDSLSSKGNSFLKRQYSRLRTLREQHKILAYWRVFYLLLTTSWIFKLACLNSWKPRWYKTLSLKDLSKIWNGLYRILTLETKQTIIRNVWIESPAGKWRQLGIPNKSWRLYLHILNMFLSYLYDPLLPKSIYDGFIFNRGCKSWWESVLWSPLLQTFSWIYELDFSSGFPNISLHSVKEALAYDGLVPLPLIHLILHHLSSPTLISSSFPTLETYIEHHENLPWRTSSRSVHMGLGISPLLFVITLNWTLNQLNLLSSNFSYKWYADDGSFYFNLRGLCELFTKFTLKDYQSLLLSTNFRLSSLLNNLEIFKEVGLRVCSQKSGLVRFFGLWLKPYKSLGLTLYTNLTPFSQFIRLALSLPINLNLKGSTRGRGSNPKTGKLGTLPCNKELNFPSKDGQSTLNLTSLLSSYKPYFGLLLSKLYSENLTSLPSSHLKFSKSSILSELKPYKLNKNLRNRDKLNLYNCSSKMNKLFLELINYSNSLETLTLYSRNFERSFKPIWSNIKTDVLKEYISNPLPLKIKPLKGYESEYFKKYSELKLDRITLTKYQLKYSLETSA